MHENRTENCPLTRRRNEMSFYHDVFNPHATATYPLADIETINTELMLADLQTVESRLGRLTREARNRPELRPLLDAVTAARDVLKQGTPDRRQPPPGGSTSTSWPNCTCSQPSRLSTCSTSMRVSWATRPERPSWPPSDPCRRGGGRKRRHRSRGGRTRSSRSLLPTH